MAKIMVNGQQILGEYAPDVDLDDFKSVYGANSDIQLLLDQSDRKILIQRSITAALSKPGEPVDMQRVALSLVGKTSNAIAANLNIHMQVYQRLAQAQTMEDVRAAVDPALPLMQRVGSMLAAGELLSVQHAQGISDEDAVIEALQAMTLAARVIQQQTTVG